MPLLQISESQILDRMRFENPWWITGRIEEYYQKLPKRLYFDLFTPLMAETSVRRAIVLMGPRRVGKTVLMIQSVKALLDRGVDPLKILFLSVETPLYNGIGLEQLFNLAQKATGNSDSKNWYVFFDEIQYLKNWEVHLKSLVDSYIYTKFIVSGSSAGALKLKSNESGAGRFTDFMLPPLTFNEYLHLKDLNRLIVNRTIEWEGSLLKFFTTNNIRELNEHFIDYINYGGYPEVIFSTAIQSDPGRYIRSDIIDKVLLRDLPNLYGIRDVQELNSLFTSIAYNSGGEVSLEELSKSSGIQKNTIKRYVEYLEAAFLIKIVHRIANKPRNFQRASFFKIHLTNPSLRCALFSPMQATDDMMGQIVETAIFAQWMHRDWFTPFYARWPKGEVDMVSLDVKRQKPLWAVEVKWSNRYFEKPNELKSLLTFLEDNNLASAMITTIDKEGSSTINGYKLNFVPAAVYAYTVGANTLIQKSTRQ